MAGRHSDDGQLAAQQESMSISHLIRPTAAARGTDGRTDSHIKCELESVDTFIALGGGRAGDRVFQVGRRGLGRQALPGREPDSEDPQSSSLSSR